MRKVIAGVLVAFVMSVVLSGCGDGGQQPPSPKPPDVTGKTIPTIPPQPKPLPAKPPTQ